MDEKAGGQLDGVQPDGPVSDQSALHETARRVRETFNSVLDSIRERSPRETMRKTGEAAEQVKHKTAEAAGQVKHYFEEHSVREMADDVSALIRRYPIPSLLVGVAVGVLLGRRRGRRFDEF